MARKVTFAVRLEQDERKVMTGEHARAVVDLDRFLAASQAGDAGTGGGAAGQRARRGPR